MSKYDFLMQVKESLKQRRELKGSVIEGNVYVRNNDTECYGVTICRDGVNVSPIFYVDRFYDAYCQKKMTIDEAVRIIVDHFETIKDTRKETLDLTLGFDEVKDRITYRLISAEKNKRYLESIPYIPFLDLAIIFIIVHNIDESGLESIRINKELMDAWGVGTKELLEIAKENTRQLFPAKIEPLTKVMGRFLQMDEEMIQDSELASPMLLLSNEQDVYGATALVYDGEAERIGEELDEDYYVIPSSVHEVLILPESEADDPDTINDIIRQINREHLGSVDILSDRSYYYCRKEKRFYF